MLSRRAPKSPLSNSRMSRKWAISDVNPNTANTGGVLFISVAPPDITL